MRNLRSTKLAILSILISLLLTTFASQSASASTVNLTWSNSEVPANLSTETRSVAWGDGHWVTSQSDHHALISQDGKTWSLGGDIGADPIHMAFGNGKFVGVADRQWVVSSDNGNTWQIGNFPPGYFYSVAFGNGVFVAVEGDNCNGVVVTSTDGQNWTTHNTASTSCWGTIAFGNGTFVIAGGHYLDYSMDNGNTWTTALNNPIGLNGDIASVAFGEEKFVAVSSSGTNPVGQIISSINNAVTWSIGNDDPVVKSGNWSSIVYGNGIWLISNAYDMDLSLETAMSSDGGQSWSGTSHTGNQWTGITYGDGLFVGYGTERYADSNNQQGYRYKLAWAVKVDDSTTEPTSTEVKKSVQKKVTIDFQFGKSGTLSKKTKAELRRLSRKCDRSTLVVITARAGVLPGISALEVKKLAKARANAIKKYLASVGITAKQISIQITVLKFGIKPKTQVIFKTASP